MVLKPFHQGRKKDSSSTVFPLKSSASFKRLQGCKHSFLGGHRWLPNTWRPIGFPTTNSRRLTVLQVLARAKTEALWSAAGQRYAQKCRVLIPYTGIRKAGVNFTANSQYPASEQWFPLVISYLCSTGCHSVASPVNDLLCGPTVTKQKVTGRQKHDLECTWMLYCRILWQRCFQTNITQRHDCPWPDKTLACKCWQEHFSVMGLHG